MSELSAEAKELLRRPIPAWVTTVRPDGSLHGTIVWVDLDGEDVYFNTAIGRAKEKQLRQDARVSVSLLNPEDPFHWVSVSGSARLDTEGADADIDALAKKYLGVDSYPGRQPGEQRVTVRITPDHVLYSGGQ
ncbi:MULTISPECIES: PPOX class F420-dependent oxidoreductase [Thermomonosporaceae]|uniref:PPOX class F420-dependent oxidoreductase n=1 Tax=Thermomonosporaceae TaxID=2012 RepID=UPI00255AFA9A|nr:MULTISPECIES: PPOX class F420-dependent oxidoreductase [Thermomonosporaceae]MDL4770620.1 PPOX class F420-dependent oxidoreductase [Actinomadura xylanilytica]